MKGRNNKSRIFDRAWAMIAALVALLLITCKVIGKLTWSWPGVALGYVWIMCSLMLAYTLLGVFVRGLRWAIKRGQEWKRRRKLARTLNESMESLTLNNIGPIYGIRRQPGEKNRSYKRRILKAARTLDTVNVQNAPKPATGQKLDEIAKKHGLRRYPHETDEKIQNRIREAVLKNLEGGQKNGRV